MIGRRLLTASVVLAAVAAGGVAGAVIGIPGISSASSSTSSSSTTTQPPGAGPYAGRHFGGFPGPSLGAGKDVLDAAAKALNLSTADLLQKLSDGKTTIADVAGQEHVDVKDVIAAMQAVANTDISNLVNNPFPGRPWKDGRKGPAIATPGSGMPGLGMPGLGMRGELRSSLDTVAKALGVSTADLRTALATGQSIADVAKSKHVDVNTLIGTLVTDAKSKIDSAVKAGDLSQDMANKIESNLQSTITSAVTNAFPKGGGAHGGFGHRFGRGRGPSGFNGPPPAATPMPSL